MTDLTYNGGPLAIDIHLPERRIIVRRGDTVEVTEEEAVRLLDMEGWQIAASDQTEEST